MREIGTIVRHLGVNPTEIELRDIISEVEEEEPTGFVRVEKFQRAMARIILRKRYPRDSADKLLRAFKTLDTKNTGAVDSNKLRDMLTTRGERFSQEEIDEFSSFAIDDTTGKAHYEDYVAQVCASHNEHS